MGRKAIHGEAMTAAERQAKKRTVRMLALERARQSVLDALAALDQGDVDGVREQLELIALDLGDLA